MRIRCRLQFQVVQFSLSNLNFLPLLFDTSVCVSIVYVWKWSARWREVETFVAKFVMLSSYLLDWCHYFIVAPFYLPLSCNCILFLTHSRFNLISSSSKIPITCTQRNNPLGEYVCSCVICNILFISVKPSSFSSLFHVQWNMHDL